MRKAIMQRTRLKNVFNKSCQPRHGIAVNTVQFLCQSFKKNKKVYFENNNVKDINNNKGFCKTIKPSFSNKGFTH